MRSIIIFLVLPVFQVYSQLYIIGGSDAKDGAYPSLCSLQSNYTTSDYLHFCGANIISRNYLLTAAHCVNDKDVNSISVFCGSNDLNSTGVRLRLVKIIVHPDYNATVKNNDLAILKLQQKLHYSKRIRPVRIGRFCDNTPESCMMVGWGRTSFPGQSTNILQELETKALTREDCQSRIDFRVIQSTQICVFIGKGKGACYGDSGSALLNVYGILIGLVSWGVPCGVGYPDVYTRVPCYIDWINSVIIK